MEAFNITPSKEKLGEILLDRLYFEHMEALASISREALDNMESGFKTIIDESITEKGLIKRVDEYVEFIVGREIHNNLNDNEKYGLKIVEYMGEIIEAYFSDVFNVDEEIDPILNAFENIIQSRALDDEELVKKIMNYLLEKSESIN